MTKEDTEQRRNLESRAKDARWIRTLTLILSLAGRGERRCAQVSLQGEGIDVAHRALLQGEETRVYLRIVRSWRWVSIQRSSPPPRSKRAGRSIAMHPPVFNFRWATSIAPVSRIDAIELSCGS